MNCFSASFRYFIASTMFVLDNSLPTFNVATALITGFSEDNSYNSRSISLLLISFNVFNGLKLNNFLAKLAYN